MENNRDNNDQQKFEQDQEREWKEMAAEIESYFPFKEQFKQFVESQENQNVS